MSSTDKNKNRNNNVVESSPSSVFRPWVFVAAAALAFGTLSSKWSTQQSTDYAVCSMSNNIHTVDAANPTVQCIVIRDSRIADVGQLGLSSRS